MGKSSRRFRLERLESRCLLAALGPDWQGFESFDPPSSATGGWQEVSAAIEISEMQGMRGAALEVSFDQTRFQVEPRDVRAGTAWGGKGLALANVDNIEGKINIFVFSAQKTERARGSLVEIDFRRSDSDRDHDLPLIDVDRLRINDQETSWEVSDQTNGPSDDSQNPTKLSMQFNIAAEGERFMATAGVGDDRINRSASDRDPYFPYGFGEQDTAEPIRVAAFESVPMIALETQRVCVPGETHTLPNEIAISQLGLQVVELQGPSKLAETQDFDWYVFAAINSNDARGMIAPLSSADRITGLATDRVADFSSISTTSTKPLWLIESGSERLPMDILVPEVADEVFSKTDFHPELSTRDSR